MSDDKLVCQVCDKKADSLKTCKSCGRDYCDECQSPSTKQAFCKDCVAMAGIVSKKD